MATLEHTWRASSPSSIGCRLRARPYAATLVDNARGPRGEHGDFLRDVGSTSGHQIMARLCPPRLDETTESRTTIQLQCCRERLRHLPRSTGCSSRLVAPTLGQLTAASTHSTLHSQAALVTWRCGSGLTQKFRKSTVARCGSIRPARSRTSSAVMVERGRTIAQNLDGSHPDVGGSLRARGAWWRHRKNASLSGSCRTAGSCTRRRRR